MDEDVRQILQSILEDPLDKKKSMAFDALNRTKEDLRNYGMEEYNIDQFVDDMTGLFVSMDQSVCETEYEIFKFASHKKISIHEFVDIVRHAKEEKVMNRTLRRIAKLDFDSKSHVLVYGVIFLSANGSFSQKEIDIIDKIMSTHL